jgi:hypothetical protein
MRSRRGGLPGRCGRPPGWCAPGLPGSAIRRRRRGQACLASATAWVYWPRCRRAAARSSSGGGAGRAAASTKSWTMPGSRFSRREARRHRSGAGAPVDVGFHRICRAEVPVRPANAKQHLRPPVIIDGRLRVLACVTRRLVFDVAGGCRRLAPGVPNRKVHDVEADIHDVKPVGSIMCAYRVEASAAGNCVRVLVQHDVDAPLDGIAAVEELAALRRVGAFGDRGSLRRGGGSFSRPTPSEART